MKVKPIDPSAVIRDPRTLRALPAKGGPVPDDVFWNRRLIAEEVRHLTKAEEAELAKEEELAAKEAAKNAKPVTPADSVAEKK